MKLKIDVATSVHQANDRQAIKNAQMLESLGVRAVNVLASPGAGKTSVITSLLRAIPKDSWAGVIEGDVASSVDTDKILALGFPAVQINTDGGCHLDAAMIARAIEKLSPPRKGFLFIENIGNLICPAGFALGESRRMVIASVPEGDDKPIKYPGIFATADAIVLNKIDLVDHVEFGVDAFTRAVRVVNPDAPIFHTSCRKGDGIQQVVDWLLK